MQPAEMRERFASARTAHLATSGGGGPHLVPICFAMVEGALVTAIDWKAKSGRPLRRLQNIQADPRVSVLVDHYDEDWTRLWWVRIDGRASLVGGAAEQAAALAALSAKYRQYADLPPAGPFLAITVERWRGWSAA